MTLVSPGRVRLRTQKPLMLDEYRDSRTTGGFILIDEATSDTVGAGMVVRAGPEIRPAVGTTVRIRQAPGRLYLFDAETGAAVYR